MRPMLTVYTIRSESEDGVYFLVNGWNKSKEFWKNPMQMHVTEYFKREQDAKASLTKLLKVMPEYRTDKFTVVKVDF